MNILRPLVFSIYAGKLEKWTPMISQKLLLEIGFLAKSSTLESYSEVVSLRNQ